MKVVKVAKPLGLAASRTYFKAHLKQIDKSVYILWSRAADVESGASVNFHIKESSYVQSKIMKRKIAAEVQCYFSFQISRSSNMIRL